MLLKKPMTNIQIIQKNVLVKFKLFTEFLKQYYLEIYTEISTTYKDVMNKIYLNKFKSYVKDMEKYQVEIYTKQDILLSDDIQSYRKQLNIKSLDLNQCDRSIFFLMNRDSILNSMQEEPIALSVAVQKQQKFLIESIFKSVSKFLLETTSNEIMFVCEFFNMTPKQSELIVTGLFKSIIQFIIDFFKNQFDHCQDIIGLLLIALINEQEKNYFGPMLFTQMDNYFSQINMMVWPRFEELFDSHIQSIKSMNIKSFKAIEKQFGFKNILMRYVDLVLSIFKLYSYFPDNRMLCVRLDTLRIQYIQLITSSAKFIEREFDQVTYLIRVYDYMLYDFNKMQMKNLKKEFTDEIDKLELSMQQNLDKFIQYYLNDFYNNLIDFVKQNAKPEQEYEVKGISEELGTQDNSQKEQKDRLVEKIKLVENLVQDIAFNW